MTLRVLLRDSVVRICFCRIRFDRRFQFCFGRLRIYYRKTGESYNDGDMGFTFQNGLFYLIRVKCKEVFAYKKVGLLFRCYGLLFRGNECFIDLLLHLLLLFLLQHYAE